MVAPVATPGRVPGTAVVVGGVFGLDVVVVAVSTLCWAFTDGWWVPKYMPAIPPKMMTAAPTPNCHHNSQYPSLATEPLPPGSFWPSGFPLSMSLPGAPGTLG